MVHQTSGLKSSFRLGITFVRSRGHASFAALVCPRIKAANTLTLVRGSASLVREGRAQHYHPLATKAAAESAIWWRVKLRSFGVHQLQPAS